MENFTAIPIITVICYLLVTAIKGTRLDSRFYPLVSCAVGIICGGVMYAFFPELVPAGGLTAALISGAASGLAATGTNQVFKQLLKNAKDGNLHI